MGGVVTSARLTHETSGVDDLAEAAPSSQYDGVVALSSASAVSEAFVLSTCNRVEAYVVTADQNAGRAVVSAFFAGAETTLQHAGHEASLEHLLSVACGLESVVVGEDQILGQLRTAYEDARRAGAIGDLLEPTITKAIHVGERARTETAINEGVVSLGSAAARLVGDRLSLEDADALVVGAGEMGTLAARALCANGARSVSVANRTVERAETLQSTLDVDGRSIPLDDVASIATDADVIVTATGSREPVIGPEALGEGHVVIVDLGQPRDVDPAVNERSTATVYDLDDLESLTDETYEKRRSAAAAVESIVAEEFDLLLEQLKRKRSDEVIAAMYESANRIKARELETALSRLDDRDRIDQADKEVVAAMADALVNQLLAAPTESLREAAVEDDWETIHTALRLFDPSSTEEEPARRPELGEDATAPIEDD